MEDHGPNLYCMYGSSKQIVFRMLASSLATAHLIFVISNKDNLFQQTIHFLFSNFKDFLWNKISAASSYPILFPTKTHRGGHSGFWQRWKMFQD